MELPLALRQKEPEMVRTSISIRTALFCLLTFSALGSLTATGQSTKTPIKHLVIVFQENVSFDHYFGTYPHALNPAGEPVFHARPGTPTVKWLDWALLHMNTNFLNPANGTGALNPFRLDRSQAATADQGHG